MILIIDGYNLLKHIFPRVKSGLSKQRDKLIYQLGFYKKQKADGIKELVLVFDGGSWGRATRETRSGIVVVFSGQKQSADDWIIDYAERNKNKELMLVTRDRELIRQCQKRSVEALNVSDFYEILQNTVLEEVGQDLKKRGVGGVQKYGEIESEALDFLMEQAPVGAYDKEDTIDVPGKKKGRKETPSKKDRKRISKIKKL
ncbi:NYN domain-containing protein [Candidatus Dependentiae bacterium]|nr:NYN domain-containing protein [Candidatus Dependentiae bacterium]